MKKNNCCAWCHKLMTEPTNFDPKKEVLICSPKCSASERMFVQLHSNEAHAMRKWWGKKDV